MKIGQKNADPAPVSKPDQIKSLAERSRDIEIKASAENRDLTPEEDAAVEALLVEAENLQVEVKAEEAQGRRDGRRSNLLKFTADAPKPLSQRDSDSPIERVVKAVPKSWGTLRAFKGPEAHRDAYTFGMWVAAAIFGKSWAERWCAQNGVPVRWVNFADGSNIRADQTEGDNSRGGFLVPEQIETTMIDLRAEYGDARKHLEIVPMTRDVRTQPRIAGGMTAYWVGEQSAITKSQWQIDQVILTAKKLGVIGIYSTELGEDAVSSIGDKIAMEAVRAMTIKEDEAAFNGDGTSGFGGIVGVRTRLLNLSATRVNIAGLFVGAGNLWSELLLTDFETVLGRLPKRFDGTSAWYVHKNFYETVMKKLAYAAGGNTVGSILGDGRQREFLGYPVNYIEVMPKTEANDQVAALYGDLRAAGQLGDRRGITMMLSEHATVGSTSMYETDSLAIRTTERLDINIHDVGNQSATAASREPGPIVGLLTAAS